MTEISQFYELAQLIKNCSKHKKSLKDIIKYINNIFDDLPEIDPDNIDESTLQEFRNRLIWDNSDDKNGFILLICCYYNNNVYLGFYFYSYSYGSKHLHLDL